MDHLSSSNKESRRQRKFSVISTSLLLLGLALPSYSGEAAPTPATAASERIFPAEPNLASLPLSFEPNEGQAPAPTRFLAHSPQATLLFSPTGVSLALKEARPDADSLGIYNPDANVEALRPERFAQSERALEPQDSVLKVHFLEANPSLRIVAGELRPGKINYLFGADANCWLTNLPTYGEITYTQLYPGIDLMYEGGKGQLKGTYLVAPEADPSRVRWRYEGVERLWLDKAGNLQLTLPAPASSIDSPSTANDNLVSQQDATFVITEQAPVAWQEVAGTRVVVDVHYGLDPDGSVDFQLGAYNRSLPLVIDPYLTYSSYLGGRGYDSAYGIAVDLAGNIYLTGRTESPDFPLANPLQPALGSLNEYDAFVTKLSPSGSALVYSTYLGGSDNDYGNAIATDGEGNAYITGVTASTDFPLANAFQSTVAAGSSAFVTKLDASGSALVFSTYLSGSYHEAGYGIAVGPDSTVYVSGEAASSDFPTMNPLQDTLRGSFDAFITKFNSAGSSLIYSTYLGGTSSDTDAVIAVDGSGSVYATGSTYSSDFPTANAIQPSLGGEGDAFVSKIDPQGSALVYSTYLGGSALDLVSGIAVGAEGAAYIAGITNSSNFPMANAIQPSLGGVQDAFVSKIDPQGSALVYSTYLGGRYAELGGGPGHLYGGIAVDDDGNAYVTGTTVSDNFPTANSLQAANAGCNDIFVSEVASDGSALLFSTYLGGGGAGCDGGNDFGSAIAIKASSIYLAGWSSSINFPVVNPFQDHKNAYDDAIVVKIASVCEAPEYSDVLPGSTFYSYVRCLACRGIISGYEDGTFRPNNLITRGQLSKIVSGAAGIYQTYYMSDQTFEDVPYGSVFFQYVERLARRGYISGYLCGGDGEPCGVDNKPYFRPGNNATRGQLAKIISNAANLGGTPSGILYTDVQEDHPFYVWIMRLTQLGAMGGYPCGGEGEPCDDQNRPYFRPYNDVTRGQTAKIGAGAFFPNCETPGW
jgi:hypothetical protein